MLWSDHCCGQPISVARLSRLTRDRHTYGRLKALVLTLTPRSKASPMFHEAARKISSSTLPSTPVGIFLKTSEESRQEGAFGPFKLL